MTEQAKLNDLPSIKHLIYLGVPKSQKTDKKSRCLILSPLNMSNHSLKILMV